MFPACPAEMILTLQSKTWWCSGTELTSWEVLPDKMVTVQDKKGSASDKPQRPITGWLPGGQSQGPDTESGRIGEISNMFDILPIHCVKPGNYNPDPNQICKHCSQPSKIS